jgi:geranylgeranyl diphosphate synthase, type I
VTDFTAPDLMPRELDRLRQRIDRHISGLIDQLQESGPERDHPLISRIYRWMRHYLDCGGQRMHGLAVILAYQACGGTDEDAIVQVAAAFQLYHHHTLVHDDIYDEDMARRGWPTTHYAFGDWFLRNSGNTPCGERRIFTSDAVRRGTIAAFAYGKLGRALAGDLITGSSFPAEARLDVAAALDRHDLFDNAAQLKDVYHEGGAIPSLQACLDNAWLKTGRLFEVCAMAGALFAGASASQQRVLQTWAGQAALAYQLQDDLEDLATGSEKGQGRGIATDLLHCKPTYLYALAKTLATGTDRDVLARWQDGQKHGLHTDDIIAILDRCGALAGCAAEVTRCVERATGELKHTAPALEEASLPVLHDFVFHFVSRAYWHRRLSTDRGRASALLA